jgi:hypothetical protein
MSFKQFARTAMDSPFNVFAQNAAFAKAESEGIDPEIEGQKLCCRLAQARNYNKTTTFVSKNPKACDCCNGTENDIDNSCYHCVNSDKPHCGVCSAPLLNNKHQCSCSFLELENSCNCN